MAKFEVVYEGKDGANHRFTFKSDKRLVRMNGNQHYGIAYPFWEEMMQAVERIGKREGTIMNRVGFACERRIKNLDTGYTVYFA